MEEGRRKNIRLTVNSSNSGDNCEDIGVDRISKLPESILSIILSFLPTRTALSTSVLSTRWRFLWTTVSNFDFYHFGYNYTLGEGTEEDKNRSIEFAQIVSKVLLHQRSVHINKFRVEWLCKFAIPSFIGAWVSTAMVRHVQHLDVVVCKRAPPIEMPVRNIFTSERLVSLELSYADIFISSAMAVCLPRLERLKLVWIEFQNEEAFQQLISGCPVIKDVDISLEEPETSFKYIVSSVSLTELRFNVDKDEDVFPDLGDHPHPRYSIELDAPNLTILGLGGPIYWISIRGSVNSLDRAWLSLPEYCDYCDWEANYYNSIVLVVSALSSAKYLRLSSHVVWAMSYATITLCTKFDRLKELDVGALRYYGSSISDLMQCSENLQVLELTMECRPVLDEVDPDAIPKNLPSWKNPEDIPVCFSKTLKTVIIENYIGCEEEYAMIDYILRSGSLIEVMKIDISSGMEIDIMNYVNRKLMLVRDVCALSRKSPTCIIDFKPLY